MRVKEVEYSRLFTFENYQNERIGFKVEIAENEDENEVLGQLFLKIIAIEDTLSEYRHYIERLNELHDRIYDTKESLERAYMRLANAEFQLQQALSKNDACALEHAEKYKEKIKEEIEEYKKQLKKLIHAYNTTLEARKVLKRYILKGEFEERPYEKLDFEEELSKIEASFKEVKE